MNAANKLEQKGIREKSALKADEVFDCLDAPIKRVTALDTPVPFAPVLEKLYVPDEGDIIRAINEIT